MVRTYNCQNKMSIYMKSMNMNIRSLFSDYRLIKLIFFILTLYLLLGEFINFFITKPTVISHSKKPMTMKEIPDITLCPSPNFDFLALKRHGYDNGYDYATGKIINNSERGWKGNSSSATVHQVLDNITSLKSLQV